MVALTIALPALLLLYRQGGLTLEATRTAAAYQEAVSRAQSRLDALTDSALVSGDREGDDGGIYHWHTRIAPVTALPPRRGTPPHSSYAAGTTLYAVSVSISWPGRSGARTVAVETRRLGPAGAP